MTTPDDGHRPEIKSEIRQVRLTDLTIDPTVQREEGVDTRRVEIEAARFNRNALGTLILSQRPDGSLIVLDGMYRCEFAKAAGYTEPLDALVYHGLSHPEEASLFLAYNTRKEVSQVSRFKARVITGDEVAVNVNWIIHAHGWRVGRGSGRLFSAVAAAEMVYRTGVGVLPSGEHPQLLTRVLDTIYAAWGHDNVGVNAVIIKGLSQLYARFGDRVDDGKLIQELQQMVPRKLLGEARALRAYDRTTTASAMARILVGLHNKKLQSRRLPAWTWTR